MTNKTFKGLITWLKGWFYDKTEVDNLTSEYIVGTQTASTSAWTGKSNKITSLSAGQVIYYKLPYASTSTAVTLNLTLANGSTTGAKEVWFWNGARMTTQYGVNSVIGLVYNGSQWWAINPSNNNNNYYLTNSEYYTSGEALTGQNLIACKKADKKYYKVKTLANTVIDISRPLLLTNGNVNANTNTNSSLLCNPWVNSTNLNGGTSLTLSSTVYQPVYLEGTNFSNGEFTVSSTPITQTLTSGRFYIMIGVAYNTTGLGVNLTNQQVLYYNGTNLIESVSWNGVVNKPTTFTPTAHTDNNGAYGKATTSVWGHTKLSSATNSTDETMSATPKAVKTAYDLANGKSTVSVKQTKTSGIEIGSVTVNGTETKLYQQDNNTTYTPASASPLTLNGINGVVGTSVKYAREDHRHPRYLSYSESNTTADGYFNMFRISVGSWCNKPYVFRVLLRGKEQDILCKLRFSNVNVSTTKASVTSFYHEGDNLDIWCYNNQNNTFDIIVKETETYYGANIEFYDGMNLLVTTVSTRLTATEFNNLTASNLTKSTFIGFTSAEKTKLNGIATGANNYSHPASHPASMIIDSENLGNMDLYGGNNQTQAVINQAINSKLKWDNQLSTTSMQPVQNRVITQALNNVSGGVSSYVKYTLTFYEKINQDYHSCNNFNIGDTAYLLVKAEDIWGNELDIDEISNYHIEVVSPDNSNVSLTETLLYGVDTYSKFYSFTVNEPGIWRFSVETYVAYINVDYNTDWTSLTLSSKVVKYSTGLSPMVRRKGDTVSIIGQVSPKTATTPSGDDQLLVATLPAMFRPTHNIKSVQQGSGSSRFLMSVNSDGTIYVSRYSNNTTMNNQIPTGAWLNLYCTYMI